MKKAGILLIFCLTGIAVCKAQTIKYYLEPIHSSIPFKLFFYNVTTVTGRFDSFWGVFDFNKTNPEKSKAEILVLSSSVDTNYPIRDEAARKEILESDKYPVISFKSTSCYRKGTQYYLTGILSLRGTSKQITVPFSIVGERPPNEREGRDFGIEGKFTIRHQDWKLKMDAQLFGPTVDLEYYLRFREPTPEKKLQEKDQPPLTLDPDQQKSYEGIFTDSSAAFQVKILDDNLFIIDRNENWMTKIVSISKDRFRLVDRPHYLLEFFNNANEVVFKQGKDDSNLLKRIR